MDSGTHTVARDSGTLEPAARGRPNSLAPKLTVRLRPRHVLWGGGCLLLIAALVYGQHYWTVGRFIESTDDAYVRADSTTVAPKVSGYISEVLVDDNQTVRQGQILARIDDRDLQAALSEADASLAAATAAVGNLGAQITAQEFRVQEAEADLRVALTAADLARHNDARRREMAKVGYGSEEQSDDAATNLRQKIANVAHARATIAGSREQIEVLRAQRDLAEAQRQGAVAVQRRAELNVSYTLIRAAIAGTVGARSVRVGQFVSAGSQLMEIVPLQQTYVVANFKETQLTHVRSGQRAEIRVDAFPGYQLNARVESIAPASGLEFSLLPPDNATGNFTKIVQRVPVKLVFDGPSELAGRLRPGMSVDVAVDTRAAAGAAGIVLSEADASDE
jgi:membrane fusion protein, multidrug efflux system